MSQSSKQESKPEPQVFDIADSRYKGAFDDMLMKARHGDKIIYSRGLFAGGLHKADARAAYDAGLVGLVQKKVKRGVFEYIAQRTKRRLKKK